MDLLAQIYNPAVSELVGNTAAYADGSGGPLETILRSLINLALGAGGIVFFLFLLWGGFTYITAGGDKESIQKAMSRIKTAIVGVSILLSVFVIVWIIETLFGIAILNFSIPTSTSTSTTCVDGERRCCDSSSLQFCDGGTWSICGACPGSCVIDRCE